MEVEIERPQTSVERQDFVLLGTKTIYDVFNERLAEIVLEYNKKFKPFDMQCARLDFRDKVEQSSKESQRIYGFVKEDMKIDFSDLDKYGKADRFELVEDKEETEYILLDGMRTQKTIGHTLNYKCKIRGHGISVFVPIVEYKELFKK